MIVFLYLLGIAALLAAGYGLLLLLEKDPVHDDTVTEVQAERMQRYTDLADTYYYLTHVLGREPTVDELWQATPPSLRAGDIRDTLPPVE